MFYYRQLRTNFQEDVVRDILTSSEAQTNLELEFEQLKKDRDTMREIFPSGNSKVCYDVNNCSKVNLNIYCIGCV